MKIVFVHPEIRIKYGTYGYQAGVAALSAALKNAGFEDVELLHVVRNESPARFRARIAAARADIVGFYTTYNQMRFVRRYVEATPEEVFTILGGPHPTIYPSCLSETEGLDAICIGEGDETIVELARAIESKNGLDGITGLAFQRDGGVVSNPPRPFIADLDALPFEDRTIFEDRRAHGAGLLEIGHANSFRLGRGCPFRCAFCSNAAQSVAQGGRYVRFRSTDHVIAEIREVVGRYRPDCIYFQDDTFMSDRRKVLEFCERYGAEVGLPFEFFGRIELIDEELLRAIRDAGGRRVSYGVESGDERLRSEVLKKRFSNDDVERAFAITKKLGIVAEAFVMTGFPGETPETAKRTADLLRRTQPDLYTLSTYFPNPGTELYDRCRAEGLLRYDDVPPGVRNQRDLMLNLPGFPARSFRSFRRWFAFRVYGSTSLPKAVLFFLFETWLGEALLRLVTPVRRSLRRFALS